MLSRSSINGCHCIQPKQRGGKKTGVSHLCLLQNQVQGHLLQEASPGSQRPHCPCLCFRIPQDFGLWTASPPATAAPPILREHSAPCHASLLTLYEYRWAAEPPWGRGSGRVDGRVYRSCRPSPTPRLLRGSAEGMPCWWWTLVCLLSLLGK